nr:hypothetical protein [Saccharopolyspora phatthalungensis]
MGEVQRQIRQRVEQSDIGLAGSAWLGLVGFVEFGHARQHGLLLGFQLVVAAAQALGERVVGVSVLGLPQDRVLTAGDIRQDSLQAFPFGLPLAAGTVIDAIQVGGQDFAAVWAEDPVGEEPRYRVEYGVFADVDRLGVALVLVRAASVVGAGPAHVVGAVVPVVAEHAPPAGAEHHPPQHVGAPGFRVDVLGIARTGAALGLCAGGHLVEHPLRDQRLVRGFR